jgi:hypothetical protein
MVAVKFEQRVSFPHKKEKQLEGEFPEKTV